MDFILQQHGLLPEQALELCTKMYKFLPRLTGICEFCQEHYASGKIKTAGVLTICVTGTAFLATSFAPGWITPRVMSLAMGSACRLED